MFRISYETWQSVCQMYINSGNGIKKSYLQWFPFSKLSEQDHEELCSESFYNKYIKSGAFILFPCSMHRTENYLQKSDGSFRDSALVSPIMFLLIQSIGKEISLNYKVQRPDDIEVYYAGNLDKLRPKYKNDYDDFFKSINSNISEYQYFIKTDLSNFFSNINIDKLIYQIDKVCNREIQHFTQTQLQLYKELLCFAGAGRYPLIENSVASSYLATIIYLDEIDKRLYNFIATKCSDIQSFKMIRFVDDMYILIQSDKPIGHLHNAYNEIRNEYSSILKEFGLALNTKKCCFKPSQDINEELKKSLYDELFNGVKKDIESLFEGSLKNFLSDLSIDLLLDYMDIESYNELIHKHFFRADIEFTPHEVFNYFVFENQNELQSPEVVSLIEELVQLDISFISLDPKRLGTMIMATQSSQVIKSLLNNLFKRHRSGKWNSYDTSIAITYLIQSKFQHIDLLHVLKKENPELYQFYDYSCRESFMVYYRRSRYNKYLDVIGKDWKTFYLYYMYIIETGRHNNMLAYAYFKNYFDRLTANLAFYISFDPSDKKPNYRNYYREGTIIKLYKSIANSENIILTAHKLRNSNPVSHSSAELIDKNGSKIELSESIKSMKKLLEDFFIEKNIQ